jgi:bifunctional UDP-N-acetylglucosamine pyrophosphorylase/glucosamine-1-phosphate N-acetyltransferase
MQAIILAAGSSTRTYPLTLTRPKPLLKVANKTILEHNLETIKDIVDEIILVVGYKKNMIKDYVKKNHPELKIRFVEQKEQLGTGHAVSILRKHIKNRFILLMGDNIYSKKDIKEVAKHQYSILVKKVKNPELFGVVKKKNHILTDIIEKPKKFISNLINCALYSLDKEIFNILKKTKRSERNEYEFTDALKLLAVKDKLYCVNSTSCLQISYPWDLLSADKELRKNKDIIGKNSKIQGKIINSTIGNNCIINGTITNSIIMDDTIIDKGSVIKDSIIGENVYFKGTIIANGLGAIISDNVKANNVVINAGCKIWPNKNIKGKIDHDIK